MSSFETSAPGRSIPVLGRDADRFVEELRSEIRSVRPHERVEFRMHGERAEVGWIAQWGEHRAFQGRTQIDLANRTIAKPQPHRVAGNVASFDDVVIHAVTPGAQSG